LEEYTKFFIEAVLIIETEVTVLIKIMII